MAPAEPSDDRLRETLLTRCRNEHLEPLGRVDRLVASARATATDRFCAATVARLDQDSADHLERLVADIDPTSPGPRQQELAATFGRTGPGRGVGRTVRFRSGLLAGLLAATGRWRESSGSAIGCRAATSGLSPDQKCKPALEVR